MNYLDIKEVVRNLELVLDNTNSEKVAVGYHSDIDGVVGAVCIKSWLKQIVLEKKIELETKSLDGSKFDESLISYIPMQYSRDGSSGFDKLLDKDVVVFIDFCPTTQELLVLIEKGCIVFVFDHHKSQKDKYTFANIDGSKLEKVQYYYDASKAGCGIALEAFIDIKYFSAEFYTKLKFVSDYAEDRDLWKFELEYSKEANAGLYLLLKTMNIEKDPEKIYQLIDGKELDESELFIQRFKELKLTKDWNKYFGKFSNTLIEIGLSKLGYDSDFVNQIFGSAERGKVLKVFIGGIEMFVLNNSNLVSEVGNKLTELDYPSCQYFIIAEPLKEPELSLSFRSTDDLPDVSKAAIKLGGGGHRNSCGATLKVSQLEDLLTGKL